MEVKGNAVGAEDILDLIVTPSQKENDQKNVDDHELFLEKILKDLVMQRSDGKIQRGHACLKRQDKFLLLFFIIIELESTEGSLFFLNLFEFFLF